MEYVDIAKRWLRGVFGADPSVVDDLAAEDVIISYPIFQKLFGQPAIRSRAAVKQFAVGFKQRWKEIEVSFHETVAQGSHVVLVWSFRGRNVGTARDDMEPTNEFHEWGGMTLIRFDSDGRIAVEIGEESTPGPIGRLHAAGR